jgi:hypothetical protein
MDDPMVQKQRRPAMQDEGVLEASDASQDGAREAMRSVATFLDSERAKRRSAKRTWVGLLGLLVGIGALHGLTLAGLLPPEGRDLIASASAVGLGLLSQL